MWLAKCHFILNILMLLVCYTKVELKINYALNVIKYDDSISMDRQNFDKIEWSDKFPPWVSGYFSIAPKVFWEWFFCVADISFFYSYIVFLKKSIHTKIFLEIGQQNCKKKYLRWKKNILKIHRCESENFEKQSRNLQPFFQF